MRKILSVVFIGLISSAFAQVDYDQINQNSSQEVNEIYHQKRSERRRVKREERRARRTARRQANAEEREEFLRFVTPLKGKFPKKEKYSFIEKKQIQFLSCVRKFVQKNKGGYQSPMLAYEMLDKVVNDKGELTGDVELLKSATKNCWFDYNSLYNFKNKSIDKDQYQKELDRLFSNDPKESSLYFVLKTLSFRPSENAC